MTYKNHVFTSFNIIENIQFKINNKFFMLPVLLSLDISRKMWPNNTRSGNFLVVFILVANLFLILAGSLIVLQMTLNMHASCSRCFKFFVWINMSRVGITFHAALPT